LSAEKDSPLMRLWPCGILPRIGITLVAIMIIGEFQWTDEGWALGIVILLWLFSPFEYYWIYRWTNEWNKNAI